ncbi:hypothetical protein D3C87_1995680 [compost metagenome]
MATLSVMMVPSSSSSTGICPSELSARNSGALCSALAKSMSTIGNAMPFSAMKMRTRYEFGPMP